MHYAENEGGTEAKNHLRVEKEGEVGGEKVRSVGYDDQSVSVPMIGNLLLIGVHTKQIQQTANTKGFSNFKIFTLFSAIWVNFTHFDKGST